MGNDIPKEQMCKFPNIILYKLTEPRSVIPNILKLFLEKSSSAKLLFSVWSSWIAQKNYMYQDIDFTWVTLLIAVLNLVNILKLSFEKSSPAMLLFYVWSSWIAQQIRCIKILILREWPSLLKS